MDVRADTSAKKTRKANFTENQLRTLVYLFSESKSLLQTKHSNTATNDRKAKVWASITSAINTISKTRRTVDNCKKKWLELKRHAIKFGNERKRPKPKGAPPPEEPWYVDLILNIIGEDSALPTGIEGTSFMFLF